MTQALLALAVVAALAAPVTAQSAAPEAAGARKDATVDATRLGVSMSRIERGLRLSESRARPGGESPFKLTYQVQVYGLAPRIDILKDFDVSPAAPLSYGAPTHREFLNQWTPQAYKAPAVPIWALAGWSLFQLAKRGDAAKCEQELATYRSLVMQGVPVSAPRCAQ